MSTLSSHLDNYLGVRRQLGFKLHYEGNLLCNFVRYAEIKRASFITTRLAFGWAIQPPNIAPTHRAKRLSIVRQFAKFASTLDHRTEVPPEKLLPGRPRRATPYLYHGDDVCRLVEAAHQIDPADKFKGVAYATMFGFLAKNGCGVDQRVLENDFVVVTGTGTARDFIRPLTVELH